MKLTIFTDGGSKGNPGPSSIGIVCYVGDQERFRYREDIGVATNNIAEYTAVIRALEMVKEKLSIKKDSSIQFYSDSRLLVNQLRGLFKVKNEHIAELVIKIQVLEQEIGIPISYHLIPREKNTVADSLVNDTKRHF